MRTFWSCIVVVGLVAAPFPRAFAEPRGGSPTESEVVQVHDWQERARVLVAQIQDASSRLAEGRAEYQRVRHHRRIRGQDKLALLTEAARAEADLDEARASLARLLEEARQGGAPPGLLREFEDLDSAEDLVVELATQAKTAEQHLTVARNFRARAARYRAMADRHREMGQRFAGSDSGWIEEQRAHCERLADLEEGVAEQYERLAAGHEARAKL